MEMCSICNKISAAEYHFIKCVVGFRSHLFSASQILHGNPAHSRKKNQHSLSVYYKSLNFAIKFVSHHSSEKMQ